MLELNISQSLTLLMDWSIYIVIYSELFLFLIKIFSYTKLSLRFFSLANLGTLVKWKNISQQTEPPELSPSILKPTIYKAKDTSQGEYSWWGMVMTILSGLVYDKWHQIKKTKFKTFDIFKTSKIFFIRFGPAFTHLRYISEIQFIFL